MEAHGSDPSASTRRQAEELEIRKFIESQLGAKTSPFDQWLLGRLTAFNVDERQSLSDLPMPVSTAKPTNWPETDMRFGEGLLAGLSRNAEGFANVAKMGYNLVTDKAYRENVLGMTKMHLAEFAEHPIDAFKDYARGISKLLHRWQDGAEDVAHLNPSGDAARVFAGAGVDLLAAAVPGSRLVKFGKLAEMAGEVTPENRKDLATAMQQISAKFDKGGLAGEGAQQALNGMVNSARKREGNLEEFIALSAKAGTLDTLLRSDALKGEERVFAALHGKTEIGDRLLVDTLQEATGKVHAQMRSGASMDASGPHKDGLERMQALVASGREQGSLDRVIDAAQKSGAFAIMIENGMLTPRELGEVAKKDHGMFGPPAGKSFDDALKLSVERMPEKQRTSPEMLVEIGVAQKTYELSKQGYADITAVKQPAGHGVDLFGIDANGKMAMFDIRNAPVPGKEQPEVPGTLTQRLADHIGHYGKDYRWPTDVVGQNESIVVKAAAKDSGALVENVRSQSLVNQPGHPDYGLYIQIYRKIEALDREHGLKSDKFSEQLAASLTVEARKQGIDQVHHVALGGKNDQMRVFAVNSENPYDPAGVYAHVDVASGRKQTLAESGQALEAVRTQQQDNALAQTQSPLQQDPSRKSQAI